MDEGALWLGMLERKFPSATYYFDPALRNRIRGGVILFGELVDRSVFRPLKVQVTPFFLFHTLKVGSLLSRIRIPNPKNSRLCGRSLNHVNVDPGAGCGAFSQLCLAACVYLEGRM